MLSACPGSQSCAWQEPPISRTEQITTALASTLEEVGVTGKLEVTSGEGKATIVLGAPNGDDTMVEVVIADLDDDAE